MYACTMYVHVCVCMNVLCMYASVCACMYVRMCELCRHVLCTHMNACVYVRSNVWIYVCMYYVRMLYVYVLTYVCMYVCMYVALEEHLRTTSLAFWVQTNMSVGMDCRVDVKDTRITHCATYLIKYICEHTVCASFACIDNLYCKNKFSQNIVHVCTLRSIV
jgi:hypothetical protein